MPDSDHPALNSSVILKPFTTLRVINPADGTEIELTTHPNYPGISIHAGFPNDLKISPVSANHIRVTS